MRKMLMLLVAVMMFGTTGCAVQQTIPHAYTPNAAAPVVQSEAYTVSVGVTDDRPYVLSGKKEPCFIGIYKAGFGNPWDVRTEGKIPLSLTLARDLAEDLRSAGFTVMDSGADRLIAVSIQEYNFNCYINCRVWHELRVQIKDSSGKILYTKSVRADQDVKGSVMWGPKAAMESEVPKIYAGMIQNIVRNDPEGMAALKRQGE